MLPQNNKPANLAMERHVDPRAVAMVKQFDGCRLKAYPDPATGGVPFTIGYGCTGTDIRPGLVWTQAEADAHLAERLGATWAGVAHLCAGRHTTPAQLSAMTSLAFNIGLGALAGSTLLVMHRAGDFANAALQFPRWNRGGGIAMPGLTRRRAAESALYKDVA